MTEVAQAATWVMTGPVRPYSIESMQAPIEPDRAGTANGADEARALRVVDVGAVDDLLDAAAAGVDDDADPIPLVLAHRREVDARVGDGLLAGGHREMDEPAHAPGHLGVHARSSGRSPRTSAAMRTSCADASKLWISRVPVTPA